MLVPDLLGKTFSEATMILQQSGITLGAVIADPGITDTSSAFIWKQVPPVLDDQNEPIHIKSGNVIDLWISKENKLQIDSLKQ